MSTETVRTIRDGEPRTSTSTFTQLLLPSVDHRLDFLGGCLKQTWSFVSIATSAECSGDRKLTERLPARAVIDSHMTSFVALTTFRTYYDASPLGH